MIAKGTKLKVSDNSGGIVVKCIKIYGVTNKKPGTIGDCILVSIRDYLPVTKQKTQINLKRKIIKGQVYKGIIIRVRKYIKRWAESVSFGDNAIVLIKNENTFLFTRILGPMAKEIRQKPWSKLALLADILV